MVIYEMAEFCYNKDWPLAKGAVILTDCAERSATAQPRKRGDWKPPASGQPLWRGRQASLPPRRKGPAQMLRIQRPATRNRASGPTRTG
jgi:hypothetical protein